MTFLRSFTRSGRRKAAAEKAAAEKAPAPAEKAPMPAEKAPAPAVSGTSTAAVSCESIQLVTASEELPLPTANADDAVQESPESGDGEAGGDADELALLKRRIKEAGVASVHRLLNEFLDETKPWETWHDKRNCKVEKTDTCLSKSISGRSRMRWSAMYPYDLEFIISFIWDDKTKSQYDEATEAMITLLDVDEDCHVVAQVFRGRFGFAGRDFCVVVNKAVVEDDQFRRAVFAAASIPLEELELVLKHVESEDNRARFEQATAKTVRGHAFNAGIIVEQSKDSPSDFAVGYVNDADLVTKGVPKWIVDRVKVDQLRIVENIPPCVDKYWVDKQAADPEPAA